MLSQETIEKMTDILVDRIEEINAYILNKIGMHIKDISTITKTDIIQLSQMLKYGGSYEEIIKKISEITKLNTKEIEKIFENVAKDEYYFAEKFYDFRGVDYIPWGQNISLQKKVEFFGNIAKENYKNLSKTTAIGYFITGKDGKKRFYNIQDTYKEIIDKAVMSVETGIDTFQNQMYKSIKELGQSSLKIKYENGGVKNLNSAVRMNILDSIAEMNQELQKDFGKEFKSDGVEISVHINSAPDHEPIQGHQFKNEEFEKMQNNHFFYDTNENYFEAIERKIGQWNCRHQTFSIVIGASKPQFSQEELKAIIDDNNIGVELNGKTYTKYQVTQMQRTLETKVREQKDINIIAKASDNEKLRLESMEKITKYTRLYEMISQKAKLPMRKDRMRVVGYKPY